MLTNSDKFFNEGCRHKKAKISLKRQKLCSGASFFAPFFLAASLLLTLLRLQVPLKYSFSEYQGNPPFFVCVNLN